MLCNRWITNDPQNKYCLLLEVIDMPNFNRYMCYGCWNIVHLKTTAKMLDIESGWQFHKTIVDTYHPEKSWNNPNANPNANPNKKMNFIDETNIQNNKNNSKR